MDNQKPLLPEQKLRLVKVGRSSQFWELMEAEILAVLKKNQAIIEKFQKDGVAEKDLPFYNRVCGRIEILEKFLELPDRMVSENESTIQKIVEGVREFAQPIYRSFVGD